MPYLLDTNVVSRLMKGHPGVVRHMQAHSQHDLWLSAITMHEVLYGAYKSLHRARLLARVEAIQLGVLEFDREDSEEAGEIRAALAVAGTLIGPFDVLIAGQARARNMTLVTHNTREFARVPRLQLEDWEI